MTEPELSSERLPGVECHFCTLALPEYTLARYRISR
jgi:hypothetical protein